MAVRKGDMLDGCPVLLKSFAVSSIPIPTPTPDFTPLTQSGHRAPF
jgi:hypothetical protein